MKREKYSLKNVKIIEAIPAEARKAPFWKRVIAVLASPARNKVGVNVSRIAKYASGAELIVVPDKVLGTGKIGAPISISAVSFSQSAKKAIEASGGKAMALAEGAKKNPTGKNAVIIK